FSISHAGARLDRTAAGFGGTTRGLAATASADPACGIRLGSPGASTGPGLSLDPASATRRSGPRRSSRRRLVGSALATLAALTGVTAFATVAAAAGALGHAIAGGANAVARAAIDRITRDRRADSG